MDRDEVRRVAALARLEIPEARLDRMAAELSRVLDFVATLDRLDLAGLEPSVLAPAGGRLREDRVDLERRLTPEQALAMAPEREGDCFLVPPIVENVNP
jgi:aspartyl-tRNA(Asn)/glutamyl-tRNA(Gln) amidotransferase subunit C